MLDRPRLLLFGYCYRPYLLILLQKSITTKILASLVTAKYTLATLQPTGIIIDLITNLITELLWLSHTVCSNRLQSLQKWRFPVFTVSKILYDIVSVQLTKYSPLSM